MFKKLLFVTALASAVLAQEIKIAAPASGTTVTAGSALTVQLERPTPSTATQEVAVAIGITACPAGCVNEGLGSNVYVSSFNPQGTDSAGNAFQNFTITVPNWFNGAAQLGVAHFYLSGATTHTAEVQLTNTKLNIVGASG